MLDGINLTGVIVGVLIGVVFTAAFSFPRMARAIGKTSSVLMLAAGAGLLTWGLISELGGSSFESLEMGPVTFYSAAQTIGWGSGLLAGGIAALVLSFVGPRK